MTEFVEMGFSKEALDVLHELSELAAQVKSHHELAQAAAGKAVAHARLAGEALICAKAKVPRGHWLPWIELNCQISRRSAQCYMQLARATLDEANAQRVADLPLRGALAVLATPRQATLPAPAKVVRVRYTESAEPLFHVFLLSIRRARGKMTKVRTHIGPSWSRSRISASNRSTSPAGLPGTTPQRSSSMPSWLAWARST